jgi:hypothetical protein
MRISMQKQAAKEDLRFFICIFTQLLQQQHANCKCTCSLGEILKLHKKVRGAHLSLSIDFFSARKITQMLHRNVCVLRIACCIRPLITTEISNLSRRLADKVHIYKTLESTPSNTADRFDIGRPRWFLLRLCVGWVRMNVCERALALFDPSAVNAGEKKQTRP